MKRVFYFICLLLCFASCDKGEMSDIDMTDRTTEPSYKSWNRKILSHDYGTDYSLINVYYNNDSIVMTYKYYFELVDETHQIVDEFSTHNMIFEGVKPAEMTDAKIKTFALKLKNELNKEPNKRDWIQDLYKIYSHNMIENENEYYGMLWGLKCDNMKVSDIYFNHADVDLDYRKNHAGYYITYHYDKDSKNEYVKVTKYAGIQDYEEIIKIEF